MSTLRPLFATALLATSLLVSSSAMAQTTTYVPEKEIKRNAAEAELGAGRIDGTLGLSGSFSLASNQNVVGQVDGFSTLVGLGLVGGLDYLKGRYEMRNTLQLNESFARTPVLEEFLKTNDVIDLENLNSYFLLDWAGIFGRVNVRTNIFQTEDVRAEANDYLLTNPDEGEDALLAQDATRFTLNRSFAPLSLNESVGVFAEPVRQEAVNLSARLGFGARQTFVDRVYVLVDDGDTAPIELQRLDDVFQAGAEAFIGARGSLQNKRITYELGASVMVPFLNNDDQNRSATELTRIAGEGNLTFGVLEWLNLVYSGKVINDPQLIDAWQIQNNLLLTFQYTLIERNTAKPTDPSEVEKAKQQAAAAAARADEAERRAAEAEARAAEAEKLLLEMKTPATEELPTPEPPSVAPEATP